MANRELQRHMCRTRASGESPGPKVCRSKIRRAAVAQCPRRCRLSFSGLRPCRHVHWGIGATVGQRDSHQGSDIPAAVGRDIGCGMMAVETSTDCEPPARQPEAFAREAIEPGRPARADDTIGGAGDRGAWGDIPTRPLEVWGRIESRHTDAIA